MYLASVDRIVRSASADRTKRVAGNVLALGAVSMVTDISSEMVAAILPLYLAIGLGLGPAVYGLVDGLYTGATALLRLVGGYVADRVRQRKLVAVAGYSLSAVAKIGLLAAGTSVPAIGAAIIADRAGKGLRTAPRDALITLSTPDGDLGRAFGVHRAMDSAGAFAGPLLALAVLAASGQAFDAVFVTSYCVATVGVLLLVLFVRDRRGPRPAVPTVSPRAATALMCLGPPAVPTVSPRAATALICLGPTAVPTVSPRAATALMYLGPPAVPTVSPRAATALLRLGPVRLLVLGAVLLGLSTIGDGFVYLLLQRRENLAVGWFPLLAVGTSLAYLLLAMPLGVLADRIGRTKVFLGGYGALVAVYLLLASPWGGPPALVLVLVLYGGFYAATDGVLMALAGPLLPPALRTTGLALVQSGQAVAYLISSVLFGLAWQWWGAGGAIRAAVVAAAVTLAGSGLLLTRARMAAPA
ncbi:MAG TPA: MFS transporter [Actinoplanes sp.]|nr:MFS transporter [Actinoplanes sp.]